MSNDIDIVVATDDRYVDYAVVTIWSIAEKVPSSMNANVYVIHEGLGDDSCMKILSIVSSLPNLEVRFLDIKGRVANMELGGYFLSAVTYYRAFLPSLLPNLHKVLYVDCDVIAMNDVSPLFNLDLSNYSVAAVQDRGISLGGEWIENDRNTLKNHGLNFMHYFNAGVILFNLDYMRKEGMEKKLEDLIKRKDLIWQDQDALNIACRDTWYELGDEWNQTIHMYSDSDLSNHGCLEREEIIKKISICHFATPAKPWLSFNSKYSVAWWAVAKRAGMMTVIKEKSVKHAMRVQKNVKNRSLELAYLCLSKLLPNSFLRKKLFARWKTLNNRRELAKNFLQNINCLSLI